ncbi:AAA family ATPase, partial [bacterium]|nr:AAA family ATPase [bacterium]
NMARLVVRKLKYSGELYEFASPPMDDGINIIEGANGTGKTTFTELLYFCLSGTADMLNPAKPHKHKEILSDKNNYVEALIQIDASYFLISRYIRSNDITVKYSDGELEIFPIYRRGNNRIFSDWFLEKLGIELIELAMGSKKWMINIKDIFRLIYHDQAPNPIDVYKVPDTEGFITDSKVMRKAIFEVLLGKSLHEYYRLLGELRAAEANRSKVKGAAELYRQMLEEIKQDQGDLNLAFLNKELENKNDQLQKLESYLESLYITPSMPKEVLAQVEQQKAELIECQMKIIQQRRKESELLDEIIKLRKVRSDLITETTQIKKMVYTHDQLSLFSADTCPYCLRYVQRTKGKCVCGADVDESKYERFFYSSEEYIDILKSKQKSVDTVDNAIEGISAELRAVMDAISSITSRVRVIESQIEKRISDSDRPIDIERTKELGGKIATIRLEITLLEQQISL